MVGRGFGRLVGDGGNWNMVGLVCFWGLDISRSWFIVDRNIFGKRFVVFFSDFFVDEIFGEFNLVLVLFIFVLKVE